MADLGRVTFLSRHYIDLRNGVLRAAFVPALLALILVGIGLAALDLPLFPRLTIGVLNIFAMTAAGVVAVQRASRWMDRRFGRVESGPARLAAFAPYLVFSVLAIVDDQLARAGNVLPP